MGMVWDSMRYSVTSPHTSHSRNSGDFVLNHLNPLRNPIRPRGQVAEVASLRGRMVEARQATEEELQAGYAASCVGLDRFQGHVGTTMTVIEVESLHCRRATGAPVLWIWG